MRKYVVENFTPSDGSAVCGTQQDHQAWLRGEAAGRKNVHMLVQFSSYDVSTDEAKDIVNKIVTALSA